MGAGRGGGDIAKGSSGGDNATADKLFSGTHVHCRAFTPSPPPPHPGGGIPAISGDAVGNESPRAPHIDRQRRRASTACGHGTAGPAGHWISQQPLRGGRNTAADRVP